MAWGRAIFGKGQGVSPLKRGQQFQKRVLRGRGGGFRMNTRGGQQRQKPVMITQQALAQKALQLARQLLADRRFRGQTDHMNVQRQKRNDFINERRGLDSMPYQPQIPRGRGRGRGRINRAYGQMRSDVLNQQQQQQPARRSWGRTNNGQNNNNIMTISFSASQRNNEVSLQMPRHKQPIQPVQAPVESPISPQLPSVPSKAFNFRRADFAQAATNLSLTERFSQEERSAPRGGGGGGQSRGKILRGRGRGLGRGRGQGRGRGRGRNENQSRGGRQVFF